MTQSTAHSAAGTPLPSPKERRRLRRAKSLSEEQVASAIGVTKATVRAWETGRSDPQGRRREAYAKLLAAPVTKAGTTAGATAEVTPEVTPEVTAQPEARPRPEPEPEPERVFGTVAGVSEKGAGPASESVSESETSESQTSESQTSESQTSESQTSESQTSESQTSESQTSSERESETEAGGDAVSATATAKDGRPSDDANDAADSDDADSPASAGTPARAGAGTGVTALAKTPDQAPDQPTRPRATSGPVPGVKPASRPDPDPDPQSPPDSQSPSDSQSPPEPQQPPKTAVPLVQSAATIEPKSGSGLAAGSRFGSGPYSASVSGPYSGSARASAPGHELTPEEAFDALYEFAAPSLVRQTYLLTGRRGLSHEAMERAFHHAWQHWPDVACDRDPVGWVRAAAYEHAMSPWQRLRPAHRHPDSPPLDEANRQLLNVLLRLPPPYRRTVLLYDGLGLSLPDTAAETEASTPATANRVVHARQAIAERLPHLDTPEALHEHLVALAAAGPVPQPTPAASVRTSSERRAWFWTRFALSTTALIVGAAGITLAVAPTKYAPEAVPSHQVGGVPGHAGPQPLTQQDKKLRELLRSEPVKGPERLVPVVR